MDGYTTQADWLLVIAWDLPVTIASDTIDKAISDVQERLDCRCRYLQLDSVPTSPNDSISISTQDDWVLDSRLREELQSIPADTTSRVIIVPLGLTTIPLGTLRCAWWFASLPSSLPCFLSEPLSYRELGQWIAQYQAPRGQRSLASIALLVDDTAITERIEGAVSTAFWANQIWPQPSQGENDRNDAVRVCFVPRPDGPGASPLRAHVFRRSSDGHLIGEIPWSSGRTSFDDRYSNPLSARVAGSEWKERWDWCHANPLSHWIVSRYLSAVRSRPLPNFVTHDWFEMRALDAEWRELNRLHGALDAQLPTEYAGKLDSVSPTSMGSAGLRYDPEGLVPWDEIWTSFCDLAMAGGPPHRGRLLEAATAESIARSPDGLAAVVCEIRRGIGLASGLRTLESPYAGWVAIACEDETMAAWLLRAILVENVVVRREGSVLYVPAAPDYRIDKEIKNVITSVAKTVHYWRAHLRSRQPPKPL